MEEARNTSSHIIPYQAGVSVDKLSSSPLILTKDVRGRGKDQRIVSKDKWIEGKGGG